MSRDRDLVSFRFARAASGLVINVSARLTAALVFRGDPRIFNRGFYCQF
jgi:hypothetical protein